MTAPARARRRFGDAHAAYAGPVQHVMAEMLRWVQTEISHWRELVGKRLQDLMLSAESSHHAACSKGSCEVLTGLHAMRAAVREGAMPQALLSLMRGYAGEWSVVEAGGAGAVDRAVAASTGVARPRSATGAPLRGSASLPHVGGGLAVTGAAAASGARRKLRAAEEARAEAAATQEYASLRGFYNKAMLQQLRRRCARAGALAARVRN